MNYPPLRIVRFSGAALTDGIEEHQIDAMAWMSFGWAWTATRRHAALIFLSNISNPCRKAQASGTEGEVSQRQSTLDNHSTTLRDLERQRRKIGGDQIKQWEAEKLGLEGQRTDRPRKRSQPKEACKKLGWSLLDLPQSFAELLGSTRQEVENWKQRSNDSRAEQFRFLCVPFGYRHRRLCLGTYFLSINNTFRQKTK